MKLNGTHKFKASSAQVFNAILNPEILKATIPGCNAVSYTDPNNLKVEITTSIPGLKGPYTINVNIARRQEPNHLELIVQRSGRGGSINAQGQINIANEADGALLSYNANAELAGTVALANNPIGEGAAKNSLSNFFKNLDSKIV